MLMQKEVFYILIYKICNYSRGCGGHTWAPTCLHIRGKLDEKKVHKSPWIQFPVNRDRRYSSWADSGESETPA